MPEYHRMHSEQTSLFAEDKIRVYKRRWWALAVLCYCGTTSIFSWNTWPPIAETLEIVFGWSDGQIALFLNLVTITFVIVVIPGSIIMDTKGLRKSMIATSICLVFVTGIRCLNLDQTDFTVLAYISAVVQGFVTVLPLAGPSLLSAVWFPVDERPTATAIATFFMYFGLSLSFVVEPQIVPGPIYHVTSCSTNQTIDDEGGQCRNVSNMHEIKAGISQVMFTQFGCSSVLFVLVLISFPDTPPSPPSITASIQRTAYKEALPTLLRNKQLWLIALALAFTIGFSNTWIAMIDVILKYVGVSQVDVGWMGFWSLTIGSLSGIFIARYSTKFFRRRKYLLTILITLALLCAIWFSMICANVLPYSLPSLYVSCISVGIFTHGAVPLFYDLVVETSYPVGEGVSGGFIMLLNNITCIIFLSIVAIPNINITCINLTVVGALIVTIPMLLIFQEQLKRSDIDNQVEPSSNEGR